MFNLSALSFLNDQNFLVNSYDPSPKSLEFYAATNEARQLLWLGGKRSLKTTSVCFLNSCHITGVYPSWWEWFKYDRPTQGLMATVKATQTRDVLQKYMLEGDPVTGLRPFIHPSLIVKRVAMQGVPGGVGILYVKHISGGTSAIKFASYAEGAKAVQSFRIDWAHLSESPDFQFYQEIIARTSKIKTPQMKEYKTFVFIDCWPEKGRDDLVSSFMNKGNPGVVVDNHFYQHSSWNNNKYLSEEEKDRLRKATPPHMLDAVEHGIPIFGVGKVFYMQESKYTCDYVESKKHYAYLLAVDPAVTENGFWGAVLIAHDRDSGVMYVIKDYLMSGISKSQHLYNVSNMLPFPKCPVVIDPAGGGEENLSDQITKVGMADFLSIEGRMDVHKAKKGSDSVELGLTDICQSILDDKVKIVYNLRDNTGCVKLIEQMRRYARDGKNKIVKADFDHVIDAMRYAFVHIDLSKRKDEVHRQFYKNQEYRAESSWY